MRQWQVPCTLALLLVVVVVVVVVRRPAPAQLQPRPRPQVSIRQLVTLLSSSAATPPLAPVNTTCQHQPLPR